MTAAAGLTGHVPPYAVFCHNSLLSIPCTPPTDPCFSHTMPSWNALQHLYQGGLWEQGAAGCCMQRDQRDLMHRPPLPLLVYHPPSAGWLVGYRRTPAAAVGSE